MAYFRGPQSPRDEQFPSNPLSPPQRNPNPNPNPNRWSASMAGSADVRGALTRRFTTNTVPTLSPIGQQRRQAAGDVQQTLGGAMNRMSLGERKQRRYEELLDIQRRVQQELAQVDIETRREVDDNRRHEQAVTQLFAQSEPTTPPEYQATYSNTFTRPNRYSAASHSMNLPSHSVPGSRRQSDDEDDDDFIYDFDSGAHRAAANPNRNSMPITSLDRKRNTTDLVLGPVNTTSFLFDDDDKHTARQVSSNTTSPPDTKTFLQVQHTADGFPKLIRREENGDLSVSAALDLASTTEQQVADRSTASRHRISLPPSGLGGGIGIGIAPLNSILANAAETRPTNNRRSVEVKFSADTKRSSLITSPPRGFVPAPHMPSSYSTNDLPTLKTINGDSSEAANTALPPSSRPQTSAEQTNGVAAHIMAPSGPGFGFAPKADENADAASNLQANAAPFGSFPQDHVAAAGFPSNIGAFSQPATFYPNYAMPLLSNAGYNNVGVNVANMYGAQGHWPNQHGNAYGNAGYGGYAHFPGGPRAHTGPGAGRFDEGRGVQQRRQQEEVAQARFNSVNVQDLAGEIYTLCKDQHGCRFLQRKLEERNDATVNLIFDEVHTHMIDLMVDPFGNYLCQKLLESAKDHQRLTLVENAAPAMTTIALNQHGTRALQKMIECVKTPEETVVIIEALRHHVVPLIQDLNGNHVIQKCLNHLSSMDAQFIFTAVGNNCVVVGTHRHGCCVLQRCIDHADGLQKGELVTHVIHTANALVQDPFGNYVVQYILDLGETVFTEPLCQAFFGQVRELSKQKFSSNVIEKCIRVAGEDTRRTIIHEIMVPPTLKDLLMDGYANYVVQTAMDFADPETKPALMEAIRGLSNFTRTLAHGRRIASKIAEFDARNQVPPATALSPLESVTSPFNSSKHSASRANRRGVIGNPSQWANGNGVADVTPYYGNNGNAIASPTPQRGNAALNMFGQGFNGNGSDMSAFAHPAPSENYMYANGQSYLNGTTANQF